MDEMNFYNKHYITVDEQNRIVNGFSDAFRQPTEENICINWMGGYQFRLIYEEHDEEKGIHVRRITEENPSLFDWDGMIPLYAYIDGKVVKRTKEEIEADRATIPGKEPTKTTEQRLTDVETDVGELNEALELILSGVTE